jgi:hypothetical protein
VTHTPPDLRAEPHLAATSSRDHPNPREPTMRARTAMRIAVATASLLVFAATAILWLAQR